MVPLREALTLSLDPHPVVADRIYPIEGVFGFGRGMIQRSPMLGYQITSEQLFRIRSGQFIYSRLKAFEGAFSLVTDLASGCFVSNEFPTFDIDARRLFHGYLGWYFKQERVWRELAIESKGIGARRERLHPERFLAYAIPVPSLDEQRRIAMRLDLLAGHIDRRKRAGESVAAETAAMLRAAFDRIASGAPRARMGDVAPLVRRPIEIRADARYQEIGVRSFGRGLFEKPDLIGGDLSWQKLFRIEHRDLVFSNIKAWEGAFAVARPEHHGKVGSHRYLTCVADTRRARPDFLWYYLQTPGGLVQVQAASPGSADRNRTLSQSGLMGVIVPLPSLDAQLWFDGLQQRVADAHKIRAEIEQELNRLLPSMLDAAFVHL